MELCLYCIHDNVQGFMAPYAAMSDAAALRDFNMMKERKDTLYNFRPEDFSLYKLGSFNTETGKINIIPLEVIA